MDCPVCHGHAFVIYARDGVHVNAWIDGDTVNFSVQTPKLYGNGLAGFRIKHCPECGRDLRDEAV